MNRTRAWMVWAGSVVGACLLGCLLAISPLDHAEATSGFTQTEAMNKILDEYLSSAAETTVTSDTTLMSIAVPSGCDILDSFAVYDTTSIDSSYIVTDTAQDPDTLGFGGDTLACYDTHDTLVAVTDSAEVDTFAWGVTVPCNFDTFDTLVAVTDTASNVLWPFTGDMPTCCDSLDTFVVVTDSFWVCIDTARAPDTLGYGLDTDCWWDTRDTFVVASDTATADDTLAIAADTLACYLYYDTRDTFVIAQDTGDVDTVSFGSAPRHMTTAQLLIDYPCLDAIDTLIEYTVDTDSYYVCTDTSIVARYSGVLDSLRTLIRDRLGSAGLALLATGETGIGVGDSVTVKPAAGKHVMTIMACPAIYSNVLRPIVLRVWSGGSSTPFNLPIPCAVTNYSGGAFGYPGSQFWIPVHADSVRAVPSAANAAWRVNLLGY